MVKSLDLFSSRLLEGRTRKVFEPTSMSHRERNDQSHASDQNMGPIVVVMLREERDIQCRN